VLRHEDVWGNRGVTAPPFFTSGIDRDEWSPSCLGRPQCPLDRRSQSRSGRLPLSGIETRPSSPYLYRLSYPGSFRILNETREHRSWSIRHSSRHERLEPAYRKCFLFRASSKVQNRASRKSNHPLYMYYVYRCGTFAKRSSITSIRSFHIV
jgi:hypothetical protein